MPPSDLLREVLDRVADALGPVDRVGAPIPGTAPGHCRRLHIEGMGDMVLKAGDGTASSAEAVADELRLLRHLGGGDHLPELLGGDGANPEHGGVPWLVLRDLGVDGWPPPWPAVLDDVWTALGRLHRRTPPTWLPHAEDHDPWSSPLPADLVGPGGLVDDDDLVVLRTAAARVSLEGDDLVHGDLSGDNLHVGGAGVTVIDWSDALVGAGEIDLLSVAVDLAHAEGRRVAPPVADLGGWLAKTAGMVMAAAARPAWPTAGGSRVRQTQRELAGTAVEWALDTNLKGPP